MKYNKLVSIFFSFMFIINFAFCSDLNISKKKTNIDYIKEYYKINKKISSSFCGYGVEQDYWKLYRKFRGDGNVVPLVENDSVDYGVIKKHLPMMLEKKIWIKQNSLFLKKRASFKLIRSSIKKQKKSIKLLLKYKREFDEDEKGEQKSAIISKSKLEYLRFRQLYTDFTEIIPFLLSYRFPVNHFALSEKYDFLKNKEAPALLRQRNEVYFHRKIVEDGAQNPNNTGNDLMFRAVIDTMYIELSQNYDFIPENVRYDIDYIHKKTLRYLKRGKRFLLVRQKEWLARTDRKYVFYQKLTSGTLNNQDKYIKNRVDSVKELKHFVLKRQAQVYKFLANQSHIMQALYVLETILYNEVGNLDGRDALERSDVARVVYNRVTDSEYNSLLPDDFLYPFLPDYLKNTTNKYPWLNVLFKTGEFSFTYFFIGQNIRVFCPSQNRLARFLRKENLNMSLDLLRKSKVAFKGIRYFSRQSMLGRFDMGKIWKGFSKIAERPGKIALKQSSLQKSYNRSKYYYLYDFKDPNDRSYRVLKIGKHIYVKPKATKVFYKYRNPHMFKFFQADPIP